ncbi:hypothetical protein G6F43_011353 [Rhizopus delemar]|nr:hypothetical protein G6F43_011353 [Rhizopus delemar]
MIEEQRDYPVNLETAELVISSASKKHNTSKLMMNALHKIKENIENRRKKNLKFYQTSTLVEGIYNKEIYSHRQLSSSIHGEIKYIENDIYQLSKQQEILKQELNMHKEEMSIIREYAEYRKNKKTKREKQYHDFYHVPILAAQYKKKYIRALDKNSDAEEQVSKVRSTVDSCQLVIIETAKAINESQKMVESLIIQKQDAENKVKQAEEMINELHEGQKFWSGFDNSQLPTALKATQALIEVIQKHERKSNTNIAQAVNNENEFVKLFKLALYQYAEAENFAESRWGNSQVEFSCAKCKNNQVGWPNLDSIRTSDLLCDSCYKETQTSMVLEKKINGMIGTENNKHIQILKEGSSFSLSSVASSSSNSSNRNKAGLKKMFQIIKNNKQSNNTNQDFSNHFANLYVS